MHHSTNQKAEVTGVSIATHVIIKSFLLFADKPAIE